MPKQNISADRQRTIKRQALFVCLCVAFAMFAGSIALSILYVQAGGAQPDVQAAGAPNP